MRTPILIAFVVAFVVGCGTNTGQPILDEGTPLRIGLYEVGGGWLIYTSNPSVDSGRPVRLAARRLSDGAETEIEADWRGSALAFDGRRAVFAVPDPASPGSAIVLYDPANGDRQVVATGRGVSLGVSGNYVVWEDAAPGGGSAIALLDTVTGQTRYLGLDDRPSGEIDESPRIEGDTAAWLRRTPASGEYRLMVHDRVANRTTATDVTAPNRLVFDVSGGRIAYRSAGGEEIFVYDVRAQNVTRIAEAPHAVDGPVIRGDVVLWSTGRDPARFRGVRGQPLLGPEDFRTVHKHNLATGRTTVAVREQFGVRRLRSDEQGRVYATVSLRTSATADTPVALRRW